MSAKQLEDFIGVIETAERSNTSRSTLWSYPTDIYATTRRTKPPLSTGQSQRSSRNTTRTPSVRLDQDLLPRSTVPVPRLWDAKSPNEWLEASFDSRTSAATTTTTATSAAYRTTASSSRRGTTAASNRSSSAAASSTTTPHLPTVRSAATAAITPSRKIRELMSLQKQAGFARVVARDLSPAQPSSLPGSPKPAKRSQSTTPKASPKPARKSSSGSTTAAPESKSSSPKSSNKPKSLSSSAVEATTEEDEVIEEVIETCSDTSLAEDTVVATSTSSSKKKGLKFRSQTIVCADDDDDASDEEEPMPRLTPPPKPKPRMKIKPAPQPVEKQQGKAKPKVIKRQATLRKRPTSAPAPEKREDKVDLRSFSKSLALLGLDIPSNRREATKLEDVGLEVRTNSPTMRTRLLTRKADKTEEVTQELKTRVEKSEQPSAVLKSDFNTIKKPLCDAVFEEWYFKKLKEYKAKKAREALEAEKEQLYKKAEDKETEAKSAEAFKDWLNEKKALHSKAARRKQRKARSEMSKEEKLERAKKAEQEWLEKKNKEEKTAAKKQRKLAEEKAKEAEKKKEESRKHFESWKTEMDQKLKAKVTEARAKRLAEVKKKQEEAAESKAAAVSAFKAWKAQKAEEAREKRRAEADKTRKAMKDPVVEEQENQKKYEDACQAYEDWLVYVERREEEERLVEEERILREAWKPPWYPA